MKKVLFLSLSLLLIVPHITQTANDGKKAAAAGLAVVGILAYAGYHYYYGPSQDNVQPQEQQLPQPPYQTNQELSKALQEDDKKQIQVVLNSTPPTPTQDKGQQSKAQQPRANSRTDQYLEEFQKQQREIEREKEFVKSLAEIKNKKEDRTIDAIIEYQLVELYY